MCEMHRRFGRSELVRSLDHLDSKYSAQLLSLMSDPDLRRRVFELIVDIATVSASALAHEGEDAYSIPVSGELLARGRALGEEIQERTSDEGLKSAVADAVRLSGPLHEVSVSGLVSSLHATHRA